MKRILFLSALFFILAVQINGGEIPETISYQGVLTDANGKAVPDGSYNLTFKLYDVEIGGIELWSEEKSVEVTKGIFNVILGSVNPLTLPFDEQYWLGIAVEGGSELTPRIQLTSSPYSLNARPGEGGNTLDQAYDQGGPGAGGTINADAGAVNIAGPEGLTVNGNVGIGTTSPWAKLDVYDGSIMVDISTSIGNDATVSGDSYPFGLSYTHHGDGSTGWPRTYGTGFTVKQSYNRMFQFDVDAVDPGGGTYMRAFYSPNWSPFRKVHVEGTDGVVGNAIFAGNVGIGTTNPGLPLEISGSAAGIRLNKTSGAGDLQFYNSGSQKWNLTSLATSYDIALWNNVAGSYSLTVKSSNGNVGMGTTEPAYKLDVAGEIHSSSGGFVFPDGTEQTTAAIGDITAVYPGESLTGGGEEGDVMLSVTDGGITTNKIANGTIVDADISSSAAISPNKISGTAWTSTNDGSGSGLDADKLDGLDSSAFLRDGISELNFQNGSKTGSIDLNSDGDLILTPNLVDGSGDVIVSGDGVDMIAENMVTDQLNLRNPTTGYFRGFLNVDSSDNLNISTLGSGRLKLISTGVDITAVGGVTINGNVGIGTLNPGSYKLAVEGKIGAREVVVTLDSWSDFVLEKCYPLMPLREVEKYIKQNKHLTDIPSEKEVLENGVSLGEMQAKLLQKVEELTLYMIEQNKKIEKLEKENEELKNRVSSLEEKIK